MLSLFRKIVFRVLSTTRYFRGRLGPEDQATSHVARERFEREILPHFDAAFNLARWLTLDDGAASDAVEQSFAQGLQRFSSYCGEDPKLWLLTIVRNVCQEQMRAGSRAPSLAQADQASVPRATNDTSTLQDAIEALPLEYREIVVMREMERMSLEQVATIEGLPEETVRAMTGRAYNRLAGRLAGHTSDSDLKADVSRL